MEHGRTFIVLYIELSGICTIQLHCIVAVPDARPVKGNPRCMLLLRRILKLQGKSFTVFADVRACHLIVPGDQIHLLIQQIDPSAEPVFWRDLIAVPSIRNQSSVSEQPEYRISHNIGADAEQGAVQAFLRFAGKIIPAVIHHPRAAIKYILGARSSLVHGISP
ncbi:hypothetical protein D3C80_1376440 [compost metagenome]